MFSFFSFRRRDDFSKILARSAILSISFAIVVMSIGVAAAQEKLPTPEIVKDRADGTPSSAAESNDAMREMQSEAVRNQAAPWAHWGVMPDKYSSWLNHSNRMIPLYTFGMTLDSLRDEGSVYADAERLKKLYGEVPSGTVNPQANYFDQTDVYRLQRQAAEAGKKHIILMVFDGMDWPTTRAAAIYKSGRDDYDRGRGTGLAFQDYRGVATDFGFIVTSPRQSGAKFDVNSQTVAEGLRDVGGGYDPTRGGSVPWQEQSRRNYLLGLDRERPHDVTDSAASATSLVAGIKTYNGAIGVDAEGKAAESIARQLQAEKGYAIGVVSSVPVSHATPAAAYSHNVTRKDYQDLSRDLLGLPSSFHRDDPLPGVDVLIGGGHGEGDGEDAAQGNNFQAGNPYLHQSDMRRANIEKGGRYVVAERTEGREGREVLHEAADAAIDGDHRLLGFFGVRGGHLPFRTADGGYDPTFDMKGTEKYSPADIRENPTLSDMVSAALSVLERDEDGFWLMVEAGDVDWANHANNLDNSIGAVLSGDSAFQTVVDWVQRRGAWDDTVLFLTSDHGHFLVLDDEQAIAEAGRRNAPILSE